MWDPTARSRPARSFLTHQHVGGADALLLGLVAKMARMKDSQQMPNTLADTGVCDVQVGTRTSAAMPRHTSWDFRLLSIGMPES
jgi:hypothetical protein